MSSETVATTGNSQTAKRALQIFRITISVLSMGFIFPHAIADGLDGADSAETTPTVKKS